MASVHKEISVDASPDAVWDAVRDFGAVHERLVKGFVVETKLDGSDRIVTFANGVSQREPLVALDDKARRLVYSAVDSPIGATHYNAAVTVRPNGDAGSRIDWVVDVLPNELEAILSQVMDAGAAAMKATLENR
jgi:carbon monoxide dehydrogenase subunit G